MIQFHWLCDVPHPSLNSLPCIWQVNLWKYLCDIFSKNLLSPKHSSNSKFELLHTSIQNVQWWRQWSLNTRWDIGRSLSCGNFLVFHVLGKCYIAGIKVASSWWHAGPVYAKYVLTTPVCQQRCLFLHLYFFKFSGGTRECQTGTCDPGP